MPKLLSGLEEKGGVNLYAFVTNAPVILIDYLGWVDLNLHTPGSDDYKYRKTWNLSNEINCSRPREFWRVCRRNRGEILSKMGRLPKALKNPAMPVRVYACGIGELNSKKRIIAHDLATKLCREIIVPDGYITLHLTIEPYPSSQQSVNPDEPDYHPSPAPDRGWIHFFPDKPATRSPSK